MAAHTWEQCWHRVRDCSGLKQPFTKAGREDGVGVGGKVFVLLLVKLVIGRFWKRRIGCGKAEYCIAMVLVS